MMKYWKWYSFDTSPIEYKKVLLELHPIIDQYGKDTRMSEEYFNSILQVIGNRKVSINLHFYEDYELPSTMLPERVIVYEIYRVISAIPNNEIEL
jgi:hypothetical protein